MENLGNNYLEKRRSESTIRHMFSPLEDNELLLRKATSEIFVTNIPSNATFLKVETGSMGDDFGDSMSFTSSNEQYPTECDDFEKNIEQYVIVSKYGLPSKTICTCHIDGSIPSSSSCTALFRSVDPTIKISKAKSCFEFAKNSEDLDSICMKHVNNLRTQRHYKEASQIYEMFLKSCSSSEDFYDVEYSFQLHYPHLWTHLSEKFNIYPDPDWVFKENESKLKIIQSCKCMLKEEEIYRVANIDLFKTKLTFSGKKKDLQEDFEVAFNYLKKEYPFLFTVLTWKHKLSKFVIEKMVLENNRLTVMKMAQLPYEVLMEHNETCTVDNDWGDHLQYEDYSDEDDEEIDY